MANPQLGLKRICQHCGAAFYDLNKNPATCPKCSTVYDPEQVLKSRRTKASPAEKMVAPAIVAEELDVPILGDVGEDAVVEDDLVVEDDEAEEAAEEQEIIEDTSDLGEDEDDMAEVIENIDEEE